MFFGALTHVSFPALVLILCPAVLSSHARHIHALEIHANVICAQGSARTLCSSRRSVYKTLFFSMISRVNSIFIHIHSTVDLCYARWVYLSIQMTHISFFIHRGFKETTPCFVIFAFSPFPPLEGFKMCTRCFARCIIRLRQTRWKSPWRPLCCCCWEPHLPDPNWQFYRHHKQGYFFFYNVYSSFQVASK